MNYNEFKAAFLSIVSACTAREKPSSHDQLLAWVVDGIEGHERGDEIMGELVRRGIADMLKRSRYEVHYKIKLRSLDQEKKTIARRRRSNVSQFGWKESDLGPDGEPTDEAQRRRSAERIDRLKVACLHYAESILDEWLLEGKTPLGDATAPLLRSLAEKEGRLSTGHQKNAEFYLRLSRRLSQGKRVREVLSAEQVEKIKADIYQRVPA